MIGAAPDQKSRRFRTRLTAPSHDAAPRAGAIFSVFLDRLRPFPYAHGIISTVSRRHDEKSRPERATFAPGEYGRMARADGTVQWYVRSSAGTWMALRHERVMENDNGTITLLFLG